MEPIKHPQTARLRSLKMYREDLDEFLGLFQRKCVRVTISDKRFRYESFDEMRKYTGPRIANLDMRATSGGSTRKSGTYWRPTRMLSVRRFRATPLWMCVSRCADYYRSKAGSAWARSARRPGYRRTPCPGGSRPNRPDFLGLADMICCVLGHVRMRALDRVTSAAPPATLFHYTTQAGLLGILRGDNLWATKIHYLNDSSEYNATLEIAEQHLGQLAENEHEGQKRARIEALRTSISHIDALNICVASFSTERDLLSQWRAYSGGRGGYSLEFHRDCLLEHAKENGFILAKCEYDEQERRDLITDLIEEALEPEFSPETAASPIQFFYPGLDTDSCFSAHLGKLASLLKDKSFHEENEWRLVSSPMMAQYMKFREGQAMLIPYSKFPLGAEKAKYLASVTVGPAPHMELAKSATSMFLRQLRINKPFAPAGGNRAPQPVDVHLSKVPYRYW